MNFIQIAKITFWYSEVSILVWSNFDCIEATLGLAGLVDDSTMCLSPLAIGIEVVDNGNDLLLLVGDVGVCGSESSVK